MYAITPTPRRAKKSTGEACCWGILGTDWGPLGAYFGLIGWGSLGASFLGKGVSWAPAGGPRSLKSQFEVKCPSWASLGALFRLSWAVSWAPLAWAVLGPSWAVLGPSWGLLGPSCLERSWGSLRSSCLGTVKAKKKERRINMLNIIYL